jgi:hypothetical protein
MKVTHSTTHTRRAGGAVSEEDEKSARHNEQKI